ncbi:PucR family transcriptional regulator [Gordonia malaquae]|uniref:PucR family transcriptional regulator n=2 Tax=Gordonia TaxID=2053 RepID=UPI0030FEA9CB
MDSSECTPAVKDLIRRAAQAVIDAPPDWFDEIDEAAFQAPDTRPVADDPALRALTVRNTHAMLTRWATANVDAPGVPVPPFIDNIQETARLMVARGHTDASGEAYRLGQNVAWRRWMKIAFGLTSDTDDLRDMLDVSAELIGTFVDATIEALTAQIAVEREHVVRGRDTARLDAVSLIVDGGAVDVPAAERLLGYRFEQPHTAIVVWTTAPSPRLSELEHTADTLAAHLGAIRTVRVVASPGAVWAWFASVNRDRLHDVESALAVGNRRHVAIGSTGTGIDGFRTSHLDAVSTQRMMARMDTDHAVATFDDVEGVLLATASPDRADRFVSHTLGPLENSHPDVRAAVREYLRAECNASRAAQTLFTHRNTLLRRIKRADELLPRPLGENALNIGIALEIRHWRGSANETISESRR